MSDRIEQDHTRFRQIVRGKIKQNLQKYISRGEMIGRKGGDLVSIPLPQIDPPDFRYGEQRTGGVGQGPGQVGQGLAPADPTRGSDAGDQPGEHILEVELSLEELAQILGEELELPRIQPRGKRNIQSQRARYTGISQAGPESLRHFRRTYRQALKRQILTGQYDPDDPGVIPIRADQQYRSWKNVPRPENAAAVIYMMDVSASMGDEQKEIVRTESFWIDAWLRSQYRGVHCCYIVHDVVAREVDQDAFYRIREGGGTAISSAYELCLQVVRERFDPAEWNVYGFHFSDGENLPEDDRRCRQLLEEHLLDLLNLFCYGQVRGHGRAAFMQVIEGLAREHDNLAASEIRSRDDILGSIRAFLGKGK
ncbi:MAG: DUF444 family protein [Candidatus Latescibacterota bacterium]